MSLLGTFGTVVVSQEERSGLTHRKSKNTLPRRRPISKPLKAIEHQLVGSGSPRYLRLPLCTRSQSLFIVLQLRSAPLVTTGSTYSCLTHNSTRCGNNRTRPGPLSGPASRLSSIFPRIILLFHLHPPVVSRVWFLSYRYLGFRLPGWLWRFQLALAPCAYYCSSFPALVRCVNCKHTYRGTSAGVVTPELVGLRHPYPL